MRLYVLYSLQITLLIFGFPFPLLYCWSSISFRYRCSVCGVLYSTPCVMSMGVPFPVFQFRCDISVVLLPVCSSMFYIRCSICYVSFQVFEGFSDRTYNDKMYEYKAYQYKTCKETNRITAKHITIKHITTKNIKRQNI